MRLDSGGTGLLSTASSRDAGRTPYFGTFTPLVAADFDLVVLFFLAAGVFFVTFLEITGTTSL